MATCFPDLKRSWLERLVIRVLRSGRMPKHIAFIMDGNRRYARKLNQENIVGHSRGFEKLAETLSWCRDLGITHATLYAFSIENFKRPPSEVDGLMNLFRQQAYKLVKEFANLETHRVCIRVYGKMELLPLDIQQEIAKIVIRTSKFCKFYLNVCFSYTAREEITTAINDLRECVAKGVLKSTDISHATVNGALYSLGLEDPDILVRTSGEIRLSDFQLWQSSFSMISFVDTLWPDFTIWHLFAGVLKYQLEFDSLQQVRNEYFNYLQEEDIALCKKTYQEMTNASQTSILTEDSGNKTQLPDTFEDFLKQREARIVKCHRVIQEKRMLFFQKLYQSHECSTLNLDDKINNNGISNGKSNGLVNGYV